MSGIKGLKANSFMLFYKERISGYDFCIIDTIMAEGIDAEGVL